VTITRYAITHRTSYHYDEAMSSGASIARLTPVGTWRQYVVESSLVVEPEPDERDEWTDRFGNRIVAFKLAQPHPSLTVTARSVIEVADHWRSTTGGPAWEYVVESTRADLSADGLLARACSTSSPHVTLDPDIRRYAAASFWPGRPILDALVDLTLRIRDEFAFDPSFSTVSTPLAEVLEHRRGVCQDFAHLEIACLRSMGLGSRYVSGYIETDPPPGMQRLVGADASHAWCSLYVPGDGWIDADPTNGLITVNRHVTLAIGRDYADVMPLHGVVFGPSAGQHLNISVDVARIG
jgi:transglutaminase-like putative cysteine protease